MVTTKEYKRIREKVEEYVALVKKDNNINHIANALPVVYSSYT